jgi:predicted ATP-dependent endonuclease of OLD family
MEDGLSELFAKPDLPAGCNEFIEFGMEEVVIQIEKRCQELKATVINEFSNLARNYIKEMIQSAQLRGYSEVIKYVDWIIIDRMMERLQNADFSAAEVENIKSMVTEIKSTNRAPGGKPKKEAYTALFLSKLLELEQAVAPLDQRIRSFVETANYYLNSKKLAFNSKDSSITLLLSESNDPLDFSQLSSGEKQIVSTFSHLILHPSECKIVLIDEPELSLSVVWQERLLSDILKYSNCLIAATHSPFIIKRPEVKKYAIDLYPVIMEQAITK